MATKTKATTNSAKQQTANGPQGKNRKDPKDALKLVQPGGRAGYVAPDKVLIAFEDGSKGVYWATPAEKKEKAVAKKTRAKKKAGKKGAKKKSKKKAAAKKRTYRKATLGKKRGRPGRVPGGLQLRKMSNDQLAALQQGLSAELAVRIKQAETELASLKKVQT